MKTYWTVISILFGFSAILVCLMLSGCGQVDANSGSKSTIYESVIEIHWSNGIQTHHELFGPIPGEGQQFSPGVNWYTPLRGASAHAKFFYFDKPTIQADLVVWRTVMIPEHTEFRLVGSRVPPGVPHPDSIELGVMSPCEETHPINQPRNQEVDITSQFNALMLFGERTNVHWEARIAPPEAMNCTTTIIN